MKKWPTQITVNTMRHHRRKQTKVRAMEEAIANSLKMVHTKSIRKESFQRLNRATRQATPVNKGSVNYGNHSMRL